MNKKYVWFLLLILVLVGGYFLFTINKARKVEVVENNMSVYSNPEIGIQFDYKIGKDGYVIAQVDGDTTTKDFVKSIILMQTKDALNINNIPEGGEGPPVMAVMVFKNTKKQWPAIWAEQNTQYSNFNLKQGEVSEMVVGSANAISYMTDGLYASEMVVVTHGEYMYVMGGMYSDIESQLRKDFQPLVQSVLFIPTSTQQ